MLYSANAPATTFTIDSSASVNIALDLVIYQAMNFITSSKILMHKTSNKVLTFFLSSEEKLE